MENSKYNTTKRGFKKQSTTLIYYLFIICNWIQLHYSIIIEIILFLWDICQ